MAYTRTNYWWVDSKGKSHFLPEMETGHIQNCIIILEDRIQRARKLRIGEFRVGHRLATSWVEIFREELRHRGII